MASFSVALGFECEAATNFVCLLGACVRFADRAVTFRCAAHGSSRFGQVLGLGLEDPPDSSFALVVVFWASTAVRGTPAHVLIHQHAQVRGAGHCNFLGLFFVRAILVPIGLAIEIGKDPNDVWGRA